MTTEKTNKALFLTLAVIGLVMLFGGFALEVLSDWFDALPESNWFRIVEYGGLAITCIASYFEAMSNPLDTRGGYFWFFFLMFAVLKIINVKDYTAPQIIALGVVCMLIILAFILNSKRWRKAKAREQEEEKE